MKLSNRQRDVATLIAKGLNRNSIADELGISVSTVDKILRVLKTKFNAQNQFELVLACKNHFEADREILKGHTGGTLERHGSDDYQTNLSFQFHEQPDFNSLFDTLQNHLKTFGITHIAYSHIKPGTKPGSIVHIASRWAVPEQVNFDFSIPPEENFAFKHAMLSWEPNPMDLEDMMRSDMYAYLPQNIKKQNDVFVAAGLIRGVTFVLPGVNYKDRLVLSVILQDISKAKFEQFVQDKLHHVYFVLQQFRNAHLNMARACLSLTDNDRQIIEHLASGHSASEIADNIQQSRRAVDRALKRIRTISNSSTNIAAACVWVEDQLEPKLPF